jgi:hypothetical protein
LHIKQSWSYNYVAARRDPLSLTDSNILLVTARMRHLHTLMLDVDCLFSARLFAQLGRQCS